MTRLRFVCLGNICRSPAAQGVTRAMAADRGMDFALDGAPAIGTSAGRRARP